MYKKINPELLSQLISEEKKFRSEQENDPIKVPVLLTHKVKSEPLMIDCTYDKGHDVPEGTYYVKLLDIKCHSKKTYKLKIYIIEDIVDAGNIYTEQVITGFVGRCPDGYYDLANCFENGVLHTSATKYISEKGIIHLSNRGWITLNPREWHKDYFPITETLKNPYETRRIEERLQEIEKLCGSQHF